MNGFGCARRMRAIMGRGAAGIHPVVLGLALLVPAATAQAQDCPFTFDSLSDESDGALDLSGQSGTVEFDPTALGIDANKDRIFNFTSINIPPGVTLHLSSAKMGARAVYWLSTGRVTIDGIVDASGENGYTAPVAGRRPANPGPGGFAGGLGNTVASSPTNGRGPGGGFTCTNYYGGGASYGANGASACVAPPPQYGNLFLVPFVGGSGGSGGWSTTPATSGGGGGG
ncbi:MAG: hypothetical protein KC466_09415, partial [Myxococcales bacterium]|nr:hypothetical protein [Myxococcales bacterium]